MTVFRFAVIVCGLAGTSITTHASEGVESIVPFEPSLATTTISTLGQLAQRVVPSSIRNYLSGYQGNPVGYQIDVSLSGVDDDSPFTSAKATWESIVTGDLPEVTAVFGFDRCGCLPCTIDDLRICGQYTRIDGTAGVLGAAGPTRVRLGSGLPYTGEMFFDIDDVNVGYVGAGVILHEMAHIMGIGTLWSRLGLANSNSVPCRYSANTKASAEYQALSGCTTAIPIENDGGRGTACGHWDETCFGSELMTGKTNGLTTLPLSRITIAGLEDLGYTVDYSQAQTYTCSTEMDASCVCACSSRRALFDGAVRPIDDTTGNEEDRMEMEEIEEVLSQQPKRRKNHRRLSDEGREAAIAQGKSLLESRKQERSATSYSLLNSEGDGGVYIGDQVINILYMEDGHIFDVLVVSDDL